jgi:hypothetical protein
MKALESRAMFCGFHHDHDAYLQQHKERIRQMRKVVDTTAPSSIGARCTSPSKKVMSSLGKFKV